MHCESSKPKPANCGMGKSQQGQQYTLLPVGALEDPLGHSAEWLPGSLWSLSGSLESAGRQCLEQLRAARSLWSSDVAGSRSGPQLPVCPGQGWCGPSWSPSEGAGGREAGAGGLRAAQALLLP